MNKFLSIFFVAIASFAITSCETDIDVNAEYKDITVVYGLIDPNESSHYVKINKTFLGEGNAFDLAANESNFNYDTQDLDVRVDAYSSQGNLVQSYSLQPTDTIAKDEGIFDNSNNILYAFAENNIDRTNTYKITIYNKALDKEILGETKIVNTSNVSVPKGSKFGFWNGQLSTGTYLAKTIDVNPGEGVGRIDAVLIFNYIEHYDAASGKPSVEKSVEMNMGEEKDLLQMQWEMKGETFFGNIESAVPAPSTIADFSHREIANISMRFNVAGTELSTFMEVEEPSTSVNQEKPDYTNLSNALGIWSSREVILWESTIDPQATNQVNLNNATISKLQSLQLGFCFGSVGTGNPVAPCP